MICYYVIYKDEEGDASVIGFDTRDLACSFIEGRLEADPFRESDDFQVIHGKALDIRIETKRIVCLEVSRG